MIPNNIFSIGQQVVGKGSQLYSDYQADQQKEQEIANFQKHNVVEPTQISADHPSDPFQLRNWQQEGRLSNLPGSNEPTNQEKEEIKGKLVDGGKPVVETPNSLEAPAAAIAVSNARATGEVSTNGRPQPPDRNAIQTKELDENGKQVLFKEIIHPNWYEDDSFYEGMLTAGLSLLSGADWATAFNSGAATFQNSRGLEERQAWAGDLQAAGYDAMEIQAYIKTGDQKVLTDPMIKQQRQMAYEMDKINFAKAQYENSPEYQAFKEQERMYNQNQADEDRLLDRRAKSQSMNLAAQSANLQERKFKYEMDKDAAEAKAKADAALLASEDGGDIKNVAEQRQLMLSGALQSGLDYKDLEDSMYEPSVWDAGKATLIAMGPESYADQAEKGLMPEFKKHKQIGNQVTELFGRGLSGGALSETKERPTWFNAIMPQSDDKPADRQRKKAVFQAMKVYSNSRAQGKAGNLELQDVDALASGRLQFMVDETGTPRAIANANGQIYKYL